MSNAPEFRVIDTGIRGGRANVAFDQMLIEARREGIIPNTIRFLRFYPSVLIGRHQILSHEINLDYCLGRGIEVGRRITGGGGLYLDQNQIGWELVFDRNLLRFSDLGDAARHICEAAALGLNKLGVPARYRPRNDIEVDGRKISGTGGFFDGNVLFYQGTLLIDFDPETMSAALRVPSSKLAKRELASAGQRIVTMRALLGERVPNLSTIYQGLLDGFAEGLNILPVWGDITQREEQLAERIYYDEVGTEAFVRMLDAPRGEGKIASAALTRPGGTVRVDIRLEGPLQDRIREILITGDFFVTPPRIILDLEASLRGVEVKDTDFVIAEFFRGAPVQFLSLKPEDIQAAIVSAVQAFSASLDGKSC